MCLNLDIIIKYLNFGIYSNILIFIVICYNKYTIKLYNIFTFIISYIINNYIYKYIKLKLNNLK